MFRSLVRAPGARAALTKRSYTTAPRVGLAGDLHPALGIDRNNPPPPILFLHGLFGSKKNNRSISKVLAQDLKRDVYALDLRNHGEAGQHPRHDYLAMADDVMGFLEHNKLKNPTVIGHSMGAKVAMVLALQSPELIKDIVSVDNSPIDAVLQSSFGKYIQGMKKIEEANVKKRSDADKILQEYEKNMQIRQFLLGNLYRTEDTQTFKFQIPLNTLGAALDHLGDFPFKDPDAVRFEKPALFVRGTKSHYVPDEALPIIGRFFPRFQLADIDAGHWVVSEKPEEFREAVVEFLKEKE